MFATGTLSKKLGAVIVFLKGEDYALGQVSLLKVQQSLTGNFVFMTGRLQGDPS